MATSNSTQPTDAAVMVMDRFVSASSSQDAVESLEEIVNGFKNDLQQQWQPSWVLDHEDLPVHLVWLLQHASLKNNDAPCEEGIYLVCQLYQYLVVNSKALQLPTPGLLLESLLDVLDHHNMESSPVYVRVLALKVLEEASKRHKATAMQQWLQAPNGLHRLADVLSTNVEIHPLEEAVRDQALQVAKRLAKEAPLAKVFLFAEVECKLLDICWMNGGMTNGKPIVMDCLQLIVELLKHADASLQDLVWQRPTITPRLMQLIDLRGGQEFRHPEQTKGKPNPSSKGPDDDDDDVDDLDNLLASGSTSKSKGKQDDEPKSDHKSEFLPKLLPSEVEVITLTLKIIRLLLESEPLRHSIWKQQQHLFDFVWDMGLMKPSIPPVCALPSSSLQQDALSLVAEKVNDPNFMAARNRLDSLLEMVCTGGYFAQTLDEKLAISQSALAVLRQTLSGEVIHDILMRTLAPPPMEEDDGPPPGPTVVQKLWATIGEQLGGGKSKERTILLSGAFGGLGVMLCDEQSREIMSKLAPIDMDALLESVFSESEEIVQCSMLRFLCEWTFRCPLVAHNLLRSPSSTHLAGMATTPSNQQSLVHLLLGLTMESLTKEEDCGGWTRTGILQIVTKIGISKFSTSLECLKTKESLKMPWMVSDMEFKSWLKFCSNAVLIVRKRVVEEFAGGSAEDDSDNDDEAEQGGGTSVKQGTKPLRKLISQQAVEMEELRQQLEKAQAKLDSQEGQIEIWKRRMESTPTDLDNMLNEFQNKTSGLEETVRELESRVVKVTAENDEAEKQFESKLAESQKEIERLRSQEQEARDDLERTEQEMQALSQAYSNLEIEYQRCQSMQGGGAPTGEASQQHGEGSKQHGSLEIVTLRAENERLRNDAKAADSWMAMAVEKMNEMGASNVELQQQVTSLQCQLDKSLASSQQESEQQQTVERERQALESEVTHLKSSLDAATKEVQAQLANVALLEKHVVESDAEIADLRGLRKLLESEQQRTAQIEQRVAESDAEMADLRGLRKVLESEKQRSAQLEAMVSDSNDGKARVQALNAELEDERQKTIELEQRLSKLQQQVDGRSAADPVSALREEYDALIAKKDAEIISLTESLRTIKEDVTHLDDKTLIERLEEANKEIRATKEKSEQDIYRLESVVRELKDRLGSDLGAYNYDDIRSRDEEIIELRKANEAAQEWMAKAVEHHQLNAAQITKLTEEKNALCIQVSELQRQNMPKKEGSLETLQGQLLERNEMLELWKEKFESSQSELLQLKKEMEANQGLLDDLGIAMDDVGVMKQKLIDSERERKSLEERIAGSAMDDELERLREVNAELESRVHEFQIWTEVAQSKISEIMASKDALQIQLDAALAEKENLNAVLEDSARDNENEIEILNATIAELESSKKTLEGKVENEMVEVARITAEVETLHVANGDLMALLEETRRANENSTLLKPVPLIEDGESISEDKDDLFARVGSLMDELRRKDDELKAANDELSEGEAVIQKWEDRVSELETELNELQQLQEQAKSEADKLQEVCETSKQRCDDLEEKLKCAIDERTVAEGKLKDLETQLIGTESVPGALDQQFKSDPEHAREMTEFEELTATLSSAQKTNADYEDAVQQLEVAKSELEASVQSLQAQLQEQEESANEAIDQWQEACVSAEEKCAELETELESLKESQRSHEALRESLDQTKYELESALQTIQNNAIATLELNCQIESLQQSSEGKDEEATRVIAELTQKLRVAEENLQKMKSDFDSALLSKQNELENERARVSELTKEVVSLREELDAQYVEAKENVRLWQERVSLSEAQNQDLQQKLCAMDSLRDQMATQESDWEQKVSVLESENDGLRQQLVEAFSQQRETVSQDEEIVRRWEARANELSETVATVEQEAESLRAELAQQEEEANKAISEWDNNFRDLELKYDNVEAELLLCNETISSRDWTIEQLKAKNEQYALQVGELRLAGEIKPAIEDDLVQASLELSRLSEVLESERQLRIDEREKFKAELADERGRHAEARDEIETLNFLLDKSKTESDDIVNQWSARFEEINEELAISQNLLKEQEDEANEVILVWDQKAEDLEKDLDSAERQLSSIREILDVDSETTDLCAAVESKLQSEIQCRTRLADLSSKCESLFESESKLKIKIRAMEEMSEAKIQEISQQLTSKSRGILEEERNRLTVVITQLEEELREANEMVQTCITDESGDKATEAAAQALRQQVRELNAQLIELHQQYNNEKSAKELATLEVERLREDLAALVSLSEAGSGTNIEILTTQAIETVQKKERAEIDQMKKALFRALDDLDAARSAERSSNEKLSKVRLQLSMYEQEIIAAKSEISFLTQAMEELRETEESKRASLEYRLGSLEHENDVVRKYHTVELESIRNELSQITMDRDRVLHQLKEIEKTNASLVFAGSKDDNSLEDTNDLDTECAKLRIEIAHLLTMAADDKARAERRLREMLAAQAASNEADVILQNELRVSAEAAVETLKVELAALRSEQRSPVYRSDEAQQKLATEQMKELLSARASLEKLKKENQDLKGKLKQAAREAEAKIEALTDECRTAQAKVHKMNQEGRFEALVQAEKSRMARHSRSPERRNLSQNGIGWIIAVDDSSVQPENVGPSLSSAEAFDLIQKQKQEILEERKMYREFLQEHDSLLALLAQLDSEKTALVEALGTTAAEEAIEMAHRETNKELIDSY